MAITAYSRATSKILRIAQQQVRERGRHAGKNAPGSDPGRCSLCRDSREKSAAALGLQFGDPLLDCLGLCLQFAEVFFEPADLLLTCLETTSEAML
jgi:hypothetical protein